VRSQPPGQVLTHSPAATPAGALQFCAVSLVSLDRAEGVRLADAAGQGWPLATRSAWWGATVPTKPLGGGSFPTPRNSKVAVSPGRGTCGSAIEECKRQAMVRKELRLLWPTAGIPALARGAGFADRALLAATLNTVHRKELLNG